MKVSQETDTNRIYEVAAELIERIDPTFSASGDEGFLSITLSHKRHFPTHP